LSADELGVAKLLGCHPAATGDFDGSGHL